MLKRENTLIDFLFDAFDTFDQGLPFAEMFVHMNR